MKNTRSVRWPSHALRAAGRSARSSSTGRSDFDDDAAATSGAGETAPDEPRTKTSKRDPTATETSGVPATTATPRDRSGRAAAENTTFEADLADDAGTAAGTADAEVSAEGGAATAAPTATRTSESTSTPRLPRRFEAVGVTARRGAAGDAYARAQLGRTSSTVTESSGRSTAGSSPRVDPRWAALDSSMQQRRGRRSLRRIARVALLLFVVTAVVAAAVWFVTQRDGGTSEADRASPAERSAVVSSDGAGEGAGESVAADVASAPPAPAVPLDIIRSVPAIPELIVQINGENVVADAAGVIDVSSFDAESTIEVIGVWSDPLTIQVEFLEWSDGITSPKRRLADIGGPEVAVGFEVRRQVVVEVEEADIAIDSVWFRSEQGADVTVPVGEPTWVASRRSRFVEGTPAVEIISYSVAPFQSLSTAEVYRPVDLAVWRITAP